MTAVDTQGNDPILPNPLEIAKAEMTPGEKLLWAETSLPGNARRRIFPISLLGWIFLLLSFAWVNKAATASMGLLVLGIPFVVGGLALASAPWWWPNITRRIIYAISDRRLLIIRNISKRKVTSYGPEDIDVVERREHRDGSGDVIFRREETQKLKHHHDPRGKRRVSVREVGFFGVPEVHRVEEAIWALKQKRDQSSVKPPDDEQRGSSDPSVERDPLLTTEKRS
ncbi:MAG: hypothetical protein ACR2QF_07180 [Geminicoccaceae bacterium]